MMAKEVQALDEAVVIISDDDEGMYTWHVSIIRAKKPLPCAFGFKGLTSSQSNRAMQSVSKSGSQIDLRQPTQARDSLLPSFSTVSNARKRPMLKSIVSNISSC